MKEWAKHWQCEEEVQNVEEKLWKNEELRKWEEALPRLTKCELEKVARSYTAKAVVGCDGFLPQFPFNFTKETRRRNREVPGEGGTEWKVAATSLHDDVL